MEKLKSGMYLNHGSHTGISKKQKNAASIMLMQRVLEIYSKKQFISIDDALEKLSHMPIYNALFDYETGLYTELTSMGHSHCCPW